MRLNCTQKPDLSKLESLLTENKLSYPLNSYTLTQTQAFLDSATKDINSTWNEIKTSIKANSQLAK